MKKIFLYVLPIVCVFVSCKPKSEFIFREEMLREVPDTLIQPDSMVPILVDIQIAESAAGQLKTDSVKTDALLKKYYPSIFAHYQISQQKFENSFAYYTEHPLVLNYIYEKVVEQINLIEKGGDAAQDSSILKKPKLVNPNEK